MKKLFIFFALLALAAIPSLAQGPVTGPYLVSYFSNNTAPAADDSQAIRLVNFGAGGTPLTSPVGDVCANIYVFDANQEMVECCSCRITPNGLIRTTVGALTSNPVTGVIPVNGDIKILSTAANGAATCTPLTLNAGLIDSTVGFATHVQLGFPTEHQIPPAALSSGEQGFLPQACQFARYLGSGKGICSCAAAD